MSVALTGGWSVAVFEVFIQFMLCFWVFVCLCIFSVFSFFYAAWLCFQLCAVDAMKESCAVAAKYIPQSSALAALLKHCRMANSKCFGTSLEGFRFLLFRWCLHSDSSQNRCFGSFGMQHIQDTQLITTHISSFVLCSWAHCHIAPESEESVGGRATSVAVWWTCFLISIFEFVFMCAHFCDAWECMR